MHKKYCFAPYAWAKTDLITCTPSSLSCFFPPLTVSSECYCRLCEPLIHWSKPMAMILKAHDVYQHRRGFDLQRSDRQMFAFSRCVLKKNKKIFLEREACSQLCPLKEEGSWNVWRWEFIGELQITKFCETVQIFRFDINYRPRSM